MLGADLRERTASFTAPVGRFIARSGIPPNAFTLLAIPVAGIAAVAFAGGHLALGATFMLLAFVTDAFDGAVARAQKRVSKFGNYLDAMVDKYVEIIPFVGLAILGYGLESFLVISGSLVLSYAKPRAALVVVLDNHDWPAIGERIDRTALIVAGILLAWIWPSFTLGGVTFNTLSTALYLVTVVVFVGSVQRVLYAKKLIETGTPVPPAPPARG